MKNLKFTLLAVCSVDGSGDHNYYGFDSIEIIQFNYDGKGNAIALVDENLDIVEADTLLHLMYSGWYSNNIAPNQYTTNNAKTV